MISYPHERDLGHLDALRARAVDELACADIGSQKLMGLGKLIAYDYALGIEPDEEQPHVFRRCLRVIKDARTIAPSVFLILAGIAAYLDIKERSTIYDFERDRYAVIPRNEARVNVRRLWIAIVDAIVATAHGDYATSLGTSRNIHISLRELRLTNRTYYGIVTLTDLLAAILNDTGVAAAWRARERFIYTSTVKTGDLYHPAGLIDLFALAVCDVTRPIATPTDMPPFVPRLP